MVKYKILGRANEPASNGYKILGKAEEEPINELAQEQESENPLLKFARNIAAGTGQMQRRLYNTLHDLAKLAEETAYTSPEARFLRAHLPESIKKHIPEFNISSHLPYQPEFDFAKYFGQKGEGSFIDNLIQGGLKYAPELVSGGALLRQLPVTAGAGIRALEKVKKEVGRRGIGNLNIPEHIIEDIEVNRFLRNTQPNRNLLERAREGHYNDLFNLQGDLGAVERGHINDPFNAANRQFGRDVGQNRQELIENMKHGLTREGAEDLAEGMTHGQNRYRQFMKFRPYRNAALLGLAAGSIPGYKYLKKLMP